MRSRYAFHTLPAAWGEALGRFDAGVMRHVAAPVLVLNGEKNRAFRSGETAFARAHRHARVELIPRGGRSGETAFARAHPHARVELIPRAGHLANFDDPAAFRDAVRRFALQLPMHG
uniref:alpha/beta fold hydrolase n=1 Tax=Streptomyces polyasparticus TaxID=2767826 RepID=UPI001F3A2B46|nr:hypothetical protein [Streptomyces polyasparticus]